jgi:hypothetical protein
VRESQKGYFPIVICGGLVVLSVLLVILGHRQGDTNAAIAAQATAAAPKPTAMAIQITVTPGAVGVASSALTKPAAAD